MEVAVAVMAVIDGRGVACCVALCTSVFVLMQLLVLGQSAGQGPAYALEHALL